MSESNPKKRKANDSDLSELSILRQADLLKGLSEDAAVVNLPSFKLNKKYLLNESDKWHSQKLIRKSRDYFMGTATALNADIPNTCTASEGALIAMEACKDVRQAFSQEKAKQTINRTKTRLSPGSKKGNSED